MTLRDSAGAETLWVLDTDYALTDADLGGGTVTATTAPATGETLVIDLDPPNTQDKSLPIGGAVPTPQIEDGLDLAAQRDAKLESLLDRAMKVPTTDSQVGSGLDLPIDQVRKGKYFFWDTLGRPSVASDIPVNQTSSYSSMYDLLDGASQVDGVAIRLSGFYSGDNNADADVYWLSTESKSNANGVTILDPDTLNGWTGLSSDINTTFHGVSGQGAGSGTGCFIIDNGRSIWAPNTGMLANSSFNNTVIWDVIQSISGDRLELDSGTYNFDSQPNAATKTVIGKGVSQTNLVRNYNAGSATEPFIHYDSNNGLGLKALALYAATGTSDGAGLVFTWDASNGPDFNYAAEDVLITYAGAGPGWGTYGAIWDGSLRVGSGIRDHKVNNLWVFGAVLVKSAVNFTADGLWCGDLVLSGTAATQNSNIRIHALAIDETTMDESNNVRVDTAQHTNSAGALTINATATNVLVTCAKQIDLPNIVNNSASASVITSLGVMLDDIQCLNVKTTRELSNNMLYGGDTTVDAWPVGVSFTAATTPANSDDTYITTGLKLLSDGNDIVDVIQDTDNTLKATIQTINKQFAFVHFVTQDNARKAVGDFVSLSARVKASAGLTTFRMAVLAWDGTGDAVTSDVVSAWAGGGTEPTWATNWTREGSIKDITVTTSFADYEENNISIDTASAKNLAVVIWLDDTDGAVSDTFNLDIVQLDHSTRACAYERKTAEQAINESERYCWKTYKSEVAPGTSDIDGCLVYPAQSTGEIPTGGQDFPRMHKEPVVSVYSTNGTLGKVAVYTSGGDIGTTVSARQISQSGFMDLSDSGAGLTAGIYYRFHLFVDGRL